MWIVEWWLWSSEGGRDLRAAKLQVWLWRDELEKWSQPSECNSSTFPWICIEAVLPRVKKILSFCVFFLIHSAFSEFCCIISLPKQRVNAILSLLAVCLVWHMRFWCFTWYPVDPVLPLPSAVLMRCLLHPAKPFLGWFECLHTSQGTMAALQGQALNSGSFHLLLNVTVLVSSW